MPAPELVGPRLKVERAIHHYDELRQEIQAFWSRTPFSVVAEDSPDGDQWIHRARIKEEVPIAWGTVIGDMLNNARSALDLLAWQLVLHNGRTPDRNTQFPIGADITAFRKQLRRNLKGASTHAKQVVTSLQPYAGGNDALWKLNELNNYNKHRLIVPVGAAFRAVEFESSFQPNKLFDDIEEEVPPLVVPFAIRPADRLFPLVDGAELYIGRPIQIEDGGIEIGARRFQFEIAFGEGQVVDGEEVTVVLQGFIDVVTDVLDRFERDVFN